MFSFFLSFVFFFAYLACSVKGQCRAPSDARQTADVKFFQCHLGGAADPNGHALSFRYGTKVKSCLNNETRRSAIEWC